MTEVWFKGTDREVLPTETCNVQIKYKGGKPFIGIYDPNWGFTTIGWQTLWPENVEWAHM